jgi:MoxR-like ATPase
MRKPFFIWGPPGIGKSKIVQTIAAMRKLQLRDVRLSQMDAVDIRGFPSPDHAKRVMNWLPPGFLPTDKKTNKTYVNAVNKSNERLERICTLAKNFEHFISERHTAQQK